MSRSGNLVKTTDGRYGIVFHEDNQKEYSGKKNTNPKLEKVIVTLTDEKYNIIPGKMKRLIQVNKLIHKGFVD